VRAPQADREIELKLVVDAGRLELLAERLRQSPAAFSASAPQALESRYFDTADRRLRARGVALRVRRVEGGFVQTLKAKTEAGGAHTVRGEWECRVAGMTPELDRIGDAQALERLGLVLPEELQPVFTTRVERHLVLVEQAVPGSPPAIIEVAFDAGTITAGELAEPIAELELELKAGPTQGLYRLLRELRQWAPVTIAVADKAQRGYRLATGEPPAASRASKPDLDPALSVSEAIGCVLDNCLGQWLQNVAAARDGRDIEGVHQLRIAVRRARSALALFAAAIEPDERQRWNGRLKAVLQATGPARELDVLLAETLPECAGGLADLDVAAAEAVRRRASVARAEAYAAVRDHLAGREHADLVLDLADWLAFEGWSDGATAARAAALDSPVVDLARRLLEKRHKRVRKLGRHFAELDDAARHEVRLALKKLRYGVEFVGGLFPGKAAKRYAKAAAALQDVLGRLNDQAETRRLLLAIRPETGGQPSLGRLDLERGIGLIVGYQARGLETERRAAAAAWDDFVEQKPFWHGADLER